MPKMSMSTRSEYLQTLLQEQGYHLKNKKEKSKLLVEYCQNTGLNRKYVIRKINSGKVWTATGKRHRAEYYDGAVTVALAALYDLFDHPCGQRLVPLLNTEIEKLRRLGELVCSDEVAGKLQKLSFRTADQKLRHHKQQARLKAKYEKSIHPLLYQQVPVKTFAEQDRTNFGLIQVDQVEHCGRSTAGEYLLSLTATDIVHGWWEGAVALGKSQKATREALTLCRQRFPLPWTELHCDNGTPILNDLTYRYCQKEQLAFSRSRPYKKNDNCLVEQKNWTHVRKKIGYLRFDTQAELSILNDLYASEYRLFKNFFQPVMKLKEKIRIGGKIKRKYDTPQTPYHRILADPNAAQNIKDELIVIYDSLNPAELKRQIDRKLKVLYRGYQEKQQPTTQPLPRVESAAILKKQLIPVMVT